MLDHFATAAGEREGEKRDVERQTDKHIVLPFLNGDITNFSTRILCVWRHSIQHNDTPQHNDSQHNNNNVTACMTMLFILTLDAHYL